MTTLTADEEIQTLFADGTRFHTISETIKDLVYKHGFTPESNLLDVGCGYLRSTMRTIQTMTTGKVFAFDKEDRYFNGAYVKSIPVMQMVFMPNKDITTWKTKELDFSPIKDTPIHFVVAVSVLTHMELKTIDALMYKLAKVMVPGAKFFATIFLPRKSNKPYELGRVHPHRDDEYYEVFLSPAFLKHRYAQNFDMFILGTPLPDKRHWMIMFQRK